MNELPPPFYDRRGRDRTIFFHIVLIFAVALVLRVTALIDTYQVKGLSLAERCGGDPGSYMAMAHHVYLVGDLGSDLFLPRPPLFPVLASLIYRLTGESPLIVIFMNLALNVFTCLVIYRIGTQIGSSPRAALLGGLVAAAYPAMISSSICYMTDALMAFFLALAVWAFLRYWARPHWRELILAGLLLACHTLTRSAALLLPFFLLIVVILRAPDTRRRILYGLIWGIVLAMPLGALTLRNAVYGGIPTFSTAGQWMLLFMRGTASERRVTGEPAEVIYARYIQEIERRIGNPVPALEDIPPEAIWEYFQPTPAQHAAISALAVEVNLRYPLQYLINTPYGLARILFAPTDDSFYPPLIGLTLNVLIFGLALIGAWSVRKRARPALTLFGLLFLSVIGVTVALQTAVLDTRHGLAAALIYFPLAGEALYALDRRFRGGPDTAFHALPG